MNTKVKFALIGTALVLGACADYSVDSDDMVVKTSNVGNGVHDIAYYAMPSDYDLETYIALNPDVKYFQIVDRLRNQDNKPRLDAMQDSTTKAEATECYNADNDAFLANETLAKMAFLMAGYPESMWKGTDSLNREQKALLVRYNKQQIDCKPNDAEDKAYIDNFQYDPDLYQMHYAAFGVLDGRPYRMCAVADITIPAGNPQAGKTVVSKPESIEKAIADIVNLADTLGAKPRIMDYSAYYFCKNEADGLVYPIWNDAGGERLVRILAVRDSLLAANPPEPETTEPEATEEPASTEDAEATEPAATEDAPATESTSDEETEETPET